MIFLKKNIIIIIVFIVVIIFLVSLKSSTKDVIITLETTPISGEIDSDGDGIADWLEEISGTDINDPSSFPYERDIIKAKKITTDELIYGGPGEFTEEIIRKFLLDTTGEPKVTRGETKEFVDISVEYFVERVEERGFPTINLKINNNVSKIEVLDTFLLSLRRFGEINTPIDVLAFEIFAKNNSILGSARRVRGICEFTLDNFPKEVHYEIYQPSYLILERITYLCEALKISIEDDGPENYFYALSLTNSGRSFNDISGSTGTKPVDAFLKSVVEVLEFLQN